MTIVIASTVAAPKASFIGFSVVAESHIDDVSEHYLRAHEVSP